MPATQQNQPTLADLLPNMTADERQALANEIVRCVNRQKRASDPERMLQHRIKAAIKLLQTNGYAVTETEKEGDEQ